ncbi:hypothetical protein Celaphus_00006255, partial [Cervus elaphus hippelaphus]
DDKKKKDAGKSAKKDKDPVNKSGGKKKKKWSKGKVRDKLNNLVLFDKATYDKLCKEDDKKKKDAGKSAKKDKDPVNESGGKAKKKKWSKGKVRDKLNNLV